MCIIIGKYFEDTGWVGFKNRDRNYIPEISFQKKITGDMELRYFWDDVTQYCEGFNSKGIGILSASLAVEDDEKEITKSTNKASPDGIKIRKALQSATVEEAVKSCVEQKLPGNTIIFDRDRLFLLEGLWTPNGGYEAKDYEHVVREVPKDKVAVRTNHGVWLEWAGYQMDPDDEKEQLSRLSSESRKVIAEHVAVNAETPQDVLDDLTKNYTNNGQMNALRTTLKNKLMRTTSQIMIIPSELTMYIRPVQSNFDFNFWNANSPDQKTWVEILGNRVLYHNMKNIEKDQVTPLHGEAPFASNLHHTV